jgi:hypothetical protein
MRKTTVCLDHQVVAGREIGLNAHFILEDELFLLFNLLERL